MPLEGNVGLVEVRFADDFELSMVGRKAVQGFLHKLIGLDTSHSRALGSLPVDENVANLVRNTLKFQPQCNKAIGTAVVGKKVPQGIDPGAIRFQNKFLVLNSTKYP